MFTIKTWQKSSNNVQLHECKSPFISVDEKSGVVVSTDDEYDLFLKNYSLIIIENSAGKTTIKLLYNGINKNPSNNKFEWVCNMPDGSQTYLAMTDEEQKQYNSATKRSN